ncbi:uncharacterized protein LOC34623050 [Cyclospora cayetanensis]|uniref:Uncharacterized protein LOC34623050 n=1 Tax=Cyclospora cayetanensis TaxID=88456 RepID=A0A6P5WD57_9EIME|nr:uncharacterized protein LOC34623050 [Cyclospora cayetanensis]
MEVELCLLELLRGGAFTVQPVGVHGEVLPSHQLHRSSGGQQQAGAARARQEALLLLPLLRRIPGVPLGSLAGGKTVTRQSLRVTMPAANCSDTTAADLWCRAAAQLLQYLLLNREALQLQQRWVLELGCGLGAPSCLCFLLGAARVCATDHDAAALSLARCNLSLSSVLNPPIGPDAASAGAADRLASAAVRALGEIRCRQYPQKKQLCVSELLDALLGNPRTSVGPLEWTDNEAAVLQQVRAAAGETPIPQAGLESRFNLILAADVLFSDKAAKALASTIKTLARTALECDTLGDFTDSPAFLCLISHEVRHAVYMHQKVMKEEADSALRSFIREFTPLGDSHGSLAQRYASKPLRPGDDSLIQTAEAAALRPDGTPQNLSSGLYVHLMEGSAPSLTEGNLPQHKKHCLSEGSVCIIAVGPNPDVLQMLPATSSFPS